MTGQPDFGAHDSLLLPRDRIRESLAEHGMHSPRAAGLAATGRPVPRGVAIELYVDVAGAHDWYAHEKNQVGRLIEDLIGHPVVLVHCPPGKQRLLPGEVIWPLEAHPSCTSLAVSLPVSA